MGCLKVNIVFPVGLAEQGEEDWGMADMRARKGFGTVMQESYVNLIEGVSWIGTNERA
jgi:hypothetical protein